MYTLWTLTWIFVAAMCATGVDLTTIETTSTAATSTAVTGLSSPAFSKILADHSSLGTTTVTAITGSTISTSISTSTVSGSTISGGNTHAGGSTNFSGSSASNDAPSSTTGDMPSNMSMTSTSSPRSTSSNASSLIESTTPLSSSSTSGFSTNSTSSNISSTPLPNSSTSGSGTRMPTSIRTGTTAPNKPPGFSFSTSTPSTSMTPPSTTGEKVTSPSSSTSSSGTTASVGSRSTVMSSTTMATTTSDPLASNTSVLRDYSALWDSANETLIEKVNATVLCHHNDTGMDNSTVNATNLIGSDDFPMNASEPRLHHKMAGINTFDEVPVNTSNTDDLMLENSTIYDESLNETNSLSEPMTVNKFGPQIRPMTSLYDSEEVENVTHPIQGQREHVIFEQTPMKPIKPVSEMPMPPLRPATTNTSKQGNDLGPLVEEKHNIQRKNADVINETTSNVLETLKGEQSGDNMNGISKYHFYGPKHEAHFGPRIFEENEELRSVIEETYGKQQVHELKVSESKEQPKKHTPASNGHDTVGSPSATDYPSMFYGGDGQMRSGIMEKLGMVNVYDNANYTVGEKNFPSPKSQVIKLPPMESTSEVIHLIGDHGNATIRRGEHSMSIEATYND
ncbi:hypothetical protein DdX_08119 [Ditylenchus destructor]|uniref:Uncharacterized protein n=1 Tax=Ditylenchus destructor TaxID=166010 RepID=A0AAD4R7H2_9BILA|nr:hypothetical protein DdX_08119 [Ditylenchus destructor]